MMKNKNFDDFQDITLSLNPDPRCPCVLVLDTSGSMNEVRPGESRSPVDALNDGLDTLVSDLHSDPLARRRAEIACVTFGGDVKLVTEFATVEDLELPHLVAGGATPMGEAVIAALELVERRKVEYKNNGISYYRPIILLITDGAATDNIKQAVKLCQEAESAKKVAIFPIGVAGADMQQLSHFSGTKEPLMLSGVKFDELFRWLSASLSAVSASNPAAAGDGVNIPSPQGWAVF